jgi:hypothetical protein
VLEEEGRGRGRADDEQVILADLSTALRMEVSMFLVEDLMGKVPMFKSLDPQVWAKILPLLRPARFERGEVVCAQGELATEMFIILDGLLEGQTDVGNDMVAQLEAKAREGGARGSIDLDGFRELSESVPASGQTKVEGEGGFPSQGIHASMSTKQRLSSLVDKSSSNAEKEVDAPGGPRSQSHGLKSPSFASSSNGESHEKKKAAATTTTTTTTKKSLAMDSRVVYSEAGVRFLRKLQPGDTVNILCVIRVWDYAVETVSCEEPVQSYAIGSDVFFGLFRECGDLIGTMRECTIETMFQMVEDMEAPTEFGAPLFLLSKKEVGERTADYAAKVEQRKVELERAKRMARMASSGENQTKYPRSTSMGRNEAKAPEFQEEL